MNINNNLLFIKKEKWFDFIENAEIYGFKTDSCNDYICKKILSDDNDLYLQITIDSISRNIFIEFNIPCAYWLEVGLDIFEPLFTLYKLGFIEMKEG